MRKNNIGGQSLLAAVLADTDYGTIRLYNPNVQMIGTVVEAAFAESTSVCVLATPGVAKDALGSYHIASAAAEVAGGDNSDFEMRKDGIEGTTVLLVDDTAYVVVEMGEKQVCLAEQINHTAQTNLADEFSSRWESASVRSINAAPREEALKKMSQRSTLGDDAAKRLKRYLSAVANTNSLTAVHAALLVTAEVTGEFYELSRWGEAQGVASAATFSRTKSKMEEAGILTVTQKAQSIGRPRDVLQFTDGHDIESLNATAAVNEVAALLDKQVSDADPATAPSDD